MDAFWPGGLTLVGQRRTNSPVCELVSAGLPSVAIRIPSHPIARDLIERAATPIAAPSANRSGHVSATHPDHVRTDLAGRFSVLIDDGPCLQGLESTIVDTRTAPMRLLRAGAVTLEEIQQQCRIEIIANDRQAATAPNSARSAPGQLDSHYAPIAPVRLNADRLLPGEALLAFGSQVPNHDGPSINLSADGDLVEAAARLFSTLRELDATRPTAIAAMPIPEDGLGRAINDRLRRASAPRPG